MLKLIRKTEYFKELFLYTDNNVILVSVDYGDHGDASISCAVGLSEFHAQRVFNDMVEGDFYVSGTGSIAPLAALKDYIFTTLIPELRAQGFSSLEVIPISDKHERAYARLCRYGFRKESCKFIYSI